MKLILVRVFALLSASILVPCLAFGTVSESEGQGPFGLSLFFMDAPSVGKAVRLAVLMNGVYPASVSGIAGVHLPPGVRVVRGDSVFHGHPGGKDRGAMLVVQFERPGTFEIKGDLSIQSENCTDEGSVALPVEVRGDTTLVGRLRLTRTECVRNGRRFRYGGWFLVPIASPENYTQSDIERIGQRAKGPRTLFVECPACTEAPRTVQMVVFVGSDGRVVDSRPRREAVVEGAFATAIRTALDKASFEPAQIHGKTAADWVFVDVSVLPSK